MRQSGIIAAGALYALEHHVERLAEDHANAQILAQGLAAIPGIRVEPAETNMVFFHVADLGVSAAQFNDAAMAQGLRFSISSQTRLRAVTHLDVTRAQIDEAVSIVRSLAPVKVP